MKEFELEQGEEIVREVRKHWFIFVMELLPFAVLALLPFALPAALSLLSSAIGALVSTINFSSTFIQMLLGLWWLLMWCSAFNRFTTYFLDAWIITNVRIVDINQKGFFHRSVSSLLLNRVQDVTVTAQGVLVSLLDIGDINVQTAGATNRFAMPGIPHPAQLRDIILKYVPDNDSKVTSETAQPL